MFYELYKVFLRQRMRRNICLGQTHKDVWQREEAQRHCFILYLCSPIETIIVFICIFLNVVGSLQLISHNGAELRVRSTSWLAAKRAKTCLSPRPCPPPQPGMKFKLTAATQNIPECTAACWRLKPPRGDNGMCETFPILPQYLFSLRSSSRSSSSVFRANYEGILVLLRESRWRMISGDFCWRSWPSAAGNASCCTAAEAKYTHACTYTRCVCRRTKLRCFQVNPQLHLASDLSIP